MVAPESPRGLRWLQLGLLRLLCHVEDAEMGGDEDGALLGEDQVAQQFQQCPELAEPSTSVRKIGDSPSQEVWQDALLIPFPWEQEQSNPS